MADGEESGDCDAVSDNLRRYFYAGFPYKTILSLLKKYHDVDISLRTLMTRLETLNLKRRGNTIDENVVRQCIEFEVESSAGNLRGYRSIWHTLRLKYHLQVPRRTVANILHEIDPEASMIRQQRKLVRRRYLAYGPNFSWHVDGEMKYLISCHGLYVRMRKAAIIFVDS